MKQYLRQVPEKSKQKNRKNEKIYYFFMTKINLKQNFLLKGF